MFNKPITLLCCLFSVFFNVKATEIEEENRNTVIHYNRSLNCPEVAIDMPEEKNL
jgi:hypothetical protein